jgi:hypothetical protein
MTTMAVGALLFCTPHIDTLFKEGIESSLGVFFVVIPVTPNVSFEFSKKTL